MCLSCVFNESLGGRRRRRAYWCTPPPPSVNAMICSRWMCKILMWPQGAARLPNLPQYHCLSTQTTTTLDCEMALFATLPIRFNEQNRCLQLNPQAVKLKIVFFLTDFFSFHLVATVIFRADCKDSAQDAEISSFCLSASSTCSKLQLVFLHIAQYLNINALVPLAPSVWCNICDKKLSELCPKFPASRKLCDCSRR